MWGLWCWVCGGLGGKVMMVWLHRVGPTIVKWGSCPHGEAYPSHVAGYLPALSHHIWTCMHQSLLLWHTSALELIWVWWLAVESNLTSAHMAATQGSSSSFRSPQGHKCRAHRDNICMCVVEGIPQLWGPREPPSPTLPHPTNLRTSMREALMKCECIEYAYVHTHIHIYIYICYIYVHIYIYI